jgi:hypothetical protein
MANLEGTNRNLNIVPVNGGNTENGPAIFRTDLSLTGGFKENTELLPARFPQGIMDIFEWFGIDRDGGTLVELEDTRAYQDISTWLNFSAAIYTGERNLFTPESVIPFLRDHFIAESRKPGFRPVSYSLKIGTPDLRQGLETTELTEEFWRAAAESDFSGVVSCLYKKSFYAERTVEASSPNKLFETIGLLVPYLVEVHSGKRTILPGTAEAVAQFYGGKLPVADARVLNANVAVFAALVMRIGLGTDGFQSYEQVKNAVGDHASEFSTFQIKPKNVNFEHQLWDGYITLLNPESIAKLESAGIIDQDSAHPFFGRITDMMVSRAIESLSAKEKPGELSVELPFANLTDKPIDLRFLPYVMLGTLKFLQRIPEAIKDKQFYSIEAVRGLIFRHESEYTGIVDAISASRSMEQGEDLSFVNWLNKVSMWKSGVAPSSLTKLLIRNYKTNPGEHWNSLVVQLLDQEGETHDYSPMEILKALVALMSDSSYVASLNKVRSEAEIGGVPEMLVNPDERVRAIFAARGIVNGDER